MKTLLAVLLLICGCEAPLLTRADAVRTYGEPTSIAASGPGYELMKWRRADLNATILVVNGRVTFYEFRQ